MRRALGLFALLVALPALAERVVVLGLPRVPQYAQVIAGYRAVRDGDPVVDLQDESAVEAAFAQPADVVVAVGSKAFDVAQAKAKGALIVATAVLGADPKGNPDVTAVPLEPRSREVLAAIAQLAPSARRIAAFYPASLSPALLDEAKAAARASGKTVDFLPVAALQGFQDQFVSALGSHQAVWLLTDARLARPEVVNFMVQACLERKVLLMGFLTGMASAGATAAVSADYPAIGREAANVVAEQLGQTKAARKGVPFHFAPGKLLVNAASQKKLGGGSVPPGAQVLR